MNERADQLAREAIVAIRAGLGGALDQLLPRPDETSGASSSS
jgi:hypothetical protein